MDRAGAVNWPPHSPDLTPVDFFVWNNEAKAYEVYKQPVNKIET